MKLCDVLCGYGKDFKYKTNFPLSLLLKSVVAVIASALLI